MHDLWTLLKGGYAYYYTPVWFVGTISVGNNPPGNNSLGNNSLENPNGNTSKLINTATVPMQQTGTPIGLAIPGLIVIIGGLIYKRN